MVKKMKKKAKINISTLIFFYTNNLGHSLVYTKSKDSGFKQELQKSVT